MLRITGVSFPTFPIGFSHEKIEFLENTVKTIKNDYNTDFIVLPELFTTGYPPKDFLYTDVCYIEQEKFIREISRISTTYNILILFGGVELNNEGKLFNVAYLTVPNKEPMIIHRKVHLPNYDIFNEKRYFTSGRKFTILRINNKYNIGVAICEDLWYHGTVETLVANGAHAIISINASPYTIGKTKNVINMLSTYSSNYHIPILYVNWYGGQDEIVYSSKSILVFPSGEKYNDLQLTFDIDEQLLYQIKTNRIRDRRALELQTNNNIIKIDIKTHLSVDKNKSIQNKKWHDNNVYKEIADTIALGISSYFKHNNISEAIIGLSGGIDSTVVLYLLARANELFGYPKLITAIFMPYKYTSDISYQVIEQLKEVFKYNNAISIITYDISEQVNTIYEGLEILSCEYLSAVYNNCFDLIGDKISRRIAKQNAQARIRGLLLTTFSNARPGSIVISCGNKTEYALGYATLYGDMAGGLAPIKDLYKTEIYELARYLGVPELVINRKPSAELDENQYDENDFGITYAEIDSMLQDIIENTNFINNEKILDRVLKNEYKRRQSPIGFKLRDESFEDRLFPISMKIK